MDWFAVDKKGLAHLLERRGKAFAIFELIQNGWDTNAKRVDVLLYRIPNTPDVVIEVRDDDPDGFSNLAHAFTLFAESEKKGDPTKRGRFNLGEKLVLALCKEAAIITTKGTVLFDVNGRHKSRRKTDLGSTFRGTMRMTRSEFDEVERAVCTLLPPSNLETYFNGELLPSRPILLTFEETLPTEMSDDEGNLRRTSRVTPVHLHEVRDGETPTLYEMGIPVVELAGGEKWHINVQQKVPLNVDRDNVTPAYLRQLRTYVLNHTHTLIRGVAEATASWVRDASADERVAPEAVERVITERFGEKRVIYDPSDPEGTKLAVSRGYTVIPAGALSKDEWRNVKAAGAALPAGKVTPSPKPYSDDGPPLKFVPDDFWTDDMCRIANFAERIGKMLLGISVVVQVTNDITWPFGATFGRSGTLVLNVGRLGKAWFEKSPDDEDVLRLLLHEFAHYRESDHLSAKYHDELCQLGAKLTRLALQQPSVFR